MTPARGIYMSGIFAIISEKENRIADAEGAAGLMTEGLSVYGRADCGYEAASPVCIREFLRESRSS